MPTVPAVMFLEMALDRLVARPPAALADELREFDALGLRFPAAVAQLTQRPGAVASYTRADVAYLLGVEVARVLLETMPAAVAAGVTL